MEGRLRKRGRPFSIGEAAFQAFQDHRPALPGPVFVIGPDALMGQRQSAAKESWQHVELPSPLGYNDTNRQRLSCWSMSHS